MKKITLLYISACLALSSCYKLDTVPYNQVSGNTFWQTEDQALAGVLGIYNDLKKVGTFGIQFAYDDLTDVGIGYDVGFGDIIAGTFTDRTGTVTSRWKSGYDLIQRANHAIGNIQNMEIDAEKKNIMISEAKFLRGLMYFQLSNLFGGLPIYDESVDLNKDFADLKNPKSSIADVQKFIIDDLTFAIENLPVKYDDKYKGRVTKGAAVALRGKVYLYQKNWANAIKDFEDVVYNKTAPYNYSLSSDYSSLFKMEGDNSAEAIFSIQNMGGTGFPYGMPMAFYMGSRSTFGSCWNNVMPSTRFADSYENKDGSPFNWDDHYANYNADNAVKREAMMARHTNGTYTHLPDTAKIRSIYANRDPRMNQSLIVPYSDYLGWNANQERNMKLVLAIGVNENFGQIRNNRGWLTYMWRKFVPEGNLKGALTDRAHTPINFPIIRLADVFLMLAEAYNENGELSKAIAELNKVRTRSSMPGLNSGSAFLAVSSKQEMQNRISHERKVELAAEGHRYFDLKRWNQLTEVSNNFIEKSIVGDNLLTRGYQTRHVIWPIPGAEIEMNPNLVQNQGW
ncbi:RagB/SusD family nutrient uptake outer membrane protein [Sphingobacterium hotanense]|uniref:RagB/SusD family nutrient uptake outer membrane protein n=1 Tax=Sphingobacterium hotanense TaxID=649196 RepID=A0ABT7NT75_9SPHI|nr:RagB/SusD family nutrient uptake outer membrane protein [Sphingobacterium hotanense]MDM1050454.1 RagB/SusD family nutrient uptake outer membrane protein [Sphingobacterium hotanense]